MCLRVVPCVYNHSDPVINQLGDLKIDYSTTQSSFIKNILCQMEDLIIFRVGDVKSLKSLLTSIENPTFEERCFLEKVKTILV